MQQLFVGPETVSALRAGPLGKYVEGFVAALDSTGYKPATVHDKMLVLAQFGRWLKRRGLGVRDLDDRRVGEFLRWRRRMFQPRRGARITLGQFLDHLRRAGELAPVVLAARCDRAGAVEEQYATYLREERALANATLVRYLPLVDRFLANRFGDGPFRLGQLKADDVTKFVLHQAHAMSPRRAKLLVTALRSFLRFLFLRGETATDLTPSVPAVADWRLARLPRFIPAADVHRLMSACNRRSATGRRDYAIILLLARLGLRASEVVQMSLDDIDWETGEVTVRGKGRRLDRLPIPRDVGEALVEYLRRDRPACSTRRFFICSKAPHRGFAGPVAISTIVRRAIDRAGLRTPTKGAHLLRHRSPNTTVLYAKVDLASLRDVAQPWPGGAA
jgi:site-specific recombinase XerD